MKDADLLTFLEAGCSVEEIAAYGGGSPDYIRARISHLKHEADRLMAEYHSGGVVAAPKEPVAAIHDCGCCLAKFLLPSMAGE